MMPRPVDMAKLQIVCAKTDRESVIRTLYNHKSMHLRAYERKANDRFDIGHPLAHSENVSLLLVKTRALMQVLGIRQHRRRSSHNHHRMPENLIHDVDELYQTHFSSERMQQEMKKLETLHEDVQKLLMRKKEADAKEKETEELIREVEWFSSFYITFDTYHEAQFPDSRIRIIAGDIPRTTAHLITEDLAEFADSLEAITEPTPHTFKLVIIADSLKEQEIESTLKKRGFVRRQLPYQPSMSGTPEMEVEALRRQLRRHRREQHEVKHRLGEIRQEWNAFLSDLELILAQESEQAQSPLGFMESEHVTVIKGYVPKSSKREIKERLGKITNGRIVIQEERIKDANEVPVALENRRGIMPFEFLLRLYSLPNYGEFDPSLLLAFTFPLFFGMMLGDIGYGLVTLPFFIWFRKKAGGLKDLADILIFSSISTIIFGFVFGEFFGYEEIGHFVIPHLIARSSNIMTMMVIAVLVGALHLTISLIIGFFNELRTKGFVRAFCGKIGWIFLELGAGLLALAIIAPVKDMLIQATGYYVPVPIAGAVMGVSICMIGYGEGVRGIVELPGIFSNMLSYMRLFAVGLASVSLAIVINDLAGPMFHAGIAGIIGGVLVLITGHAVNMVLGMLGPFLHSLRLHYVESFTKFYEGGGKAYKPFGT